MQTEILLEAGTFLNVVTVVPLPFFPPMVQQPQVSHGLPIIDGSRSHSDTSYPVEFLWTRNQTGAQTST